MKRFISIILAIALCSSAFAYAIAVSAESNSTEQKKYIAITFDDGPNNGTCVDVLDVLKQFNAKATFFAIGTNCTSSTRKTMQRILDQGCEIGIHGYNHENISGMNITEINENIDKAIAAVQAQVDYTPTIYRLPYLAMPQSTYAKKIEIPLISGSGPADYNYSVTTQQRIEGYLSVAKDGEIFLCHCIDGNYQTVEAMKTIIPTLQEQGYELVTVSELFEKQGTYPTRGYQWVNVPKAENIAMPEKYSGVYEAEKVFTKSSTTTTRNNQNDIAPFGTAYLETSVGQTGYFDFSLPNVKPGTYTLHIYSRDSSKNRLANLTANGVDLGNINFNNSALLYKHHYLNESNEALKITVTEEGNVDLHFTLANYTSDATMAFDKFVLVSDDDAQNDLTNATTAPITTQPTTEKPIMYGDVNDDRAINSRDVLALRKYLAKWNIEINLKAADVSKDGAVNAKDVLLIRKYNVKIITSF